MQDISRLLRSLSALASTLPRLGHLLPTLLVLIPWLVLAHVRYQVDLLTPLPIALTILASALLTQIADLIGLQREQRLHDHWGGGPAVRMMRHRDQAANEATKRVWHEHLTRHFNIDMPTRAEEQIDPAAADATYAQAAGLVERAAVDPLLFRALWQRRMLYEFLLKGLALRALGLTSCIVTLLWVCGSVSFGTAPRWEPIISISVHLGSPAMLITIIVAIIWPVVFTAANVHWVARAHAELLFGSIDLIKR